MSRTDTLKHYGETLVETGRTGLLAALGAGDVAVDRARTVVDGLRSRAEALPGEAQVQADLGAKEARARVVAAREQARRAAVHARSTVTELRPETVLGTVTGLVDGARAQALEAIGELAGRGEQLVGDLRRQPVFRKVVARTERAVDAVEDGLEDVLDETAETVAEASDTVTSVAQKTAARTTAAVESATADVQEAAESTKATLADAAEPAPAEAVVVEPVTAEPAVETPAAKTPAAKTPAAKPAKAQLPDPLAVPAKTRRSGK
ncbi:hypothetical protein GCU67_03750 [Modestobacter muralis]|uniref:Heparin-binding hemagglutinin n=1 Tax=Modestobacter muralis TaxID=1608614 RepID=A0A6P0ETJ0_9ACTN|nr:hypothetical protein [Modestobacter muralis]NEK93294.1 hypothetical protein [Modestobacter muralis]NEN50061.1 hypothetical protein [Modestobacter muralis]